MTMQNRRTVPVRDADGEVLLFEAPAGSAARPDGDVFLALGDGRRIAVPADMLEARPDGSYYLPVSVRELRAQGAQAQPATRAGSSSAGLADGGQRVIPVIEETLDVRKQTTSRQVRVRKLVREHEEVIDEPLLQEDVEIERVPISRYVDGPVPVRYEGDVMVVPLLEEVLVVERRLIVREELRITKRRSEVREVRRETLRSEHVEVERTPARRGPGVSTNATPPRAGGAPAADEQAEGRDGASTV